MEVKNAKITGTKLGYEDHSILTYYIFLDYGDSGQGFGGYAMDEYNKTTEQREPSIIFGKHIKEILTTVGVDNWEDLSGKYIRVKSEHSKVHEIGNILKDTWFNPSII